MKAPIFATLALSLLIGQAPAQAQQPNSTAIAQSDVSSQGQFAGPHVDRTSSGDADHPVPHVYKRGEHLTNAYGSFDIVPDWNRLRLAPPPEGYHWVHFGLNYMLVQSNSGLITDIVAQS